MYNKYDYHHRVLVYLNDMMNKYLDQKEQNKINETLVYGVPFDFTAEEISEALKVDVVKIKATLVDLNELGFIDSNSFRYSSKENTSTYIDSQYFKNKRCRYIKKEIIDDVKTAFIIVLGIISIYTFFNAEKEISDLQSELEIIKAELNTMKIDLINHEIHLNNQN